MRVESKTIRYHFEIKDKTPFSYAVTLTSDGASSHVDESNAPDWARLDFQPCEGCSLHNTDYCPVAIRLVEPVKHFTGLVSHEEAVVTVETPNRLYYKATDVQTGASGLFGLIMATSGCPTLAPFRAMAWFHLPFSSPEETFFRLASTQALTKILDGESPTVDSVRDGINDLYKRVNLVNAGVVQRLRAAAAAKADSSYNALVILDGLSSLLPLVANDQIEGLRRLMQPST
jgi:hypothetical protein